jgi:hypothetical protein
MIRTIAIVATILTTGAAGAHAQTASPWPGGAGARDSSLSVSARAIGVATGTASYRGRVTLRRHGATRAEAEAAIERAISEVVAIGGVEVRSSRREIGRAVIEEPQSPPVFIEEATIEVEARNRKAITDWAGKIQPSPSTQSQMSDTSPAIIERLSDADPAWELAARNALAAAERDARIAAEASGGELGRLVGLWTERLANVVDGNAQVQVTAEYLIGRRR